jgi:hypothetical protein
MLYKNVAVLHSDNHTVLIDNSVNEMQSFYIQVAPAHE